MKAPRSTLWDWLARFRQNRNDVKAKSKKRCEKNESPASSPSDDVRSNATRKNKNVGPNQVEVELEARPHPTFELPIFLAVLYTSFFLGVLLSFIFIFIYRWPYVSYG